MPCFYAADIRVEEPQPFCSSGGNLGNGRTRTAMYTDSIEQLRGTAGARQVRLGRDCAGGIHHAKQWRLDHVWQIPELTLKALVVGVGLIAAFAAAVPAQALSIQSFYNTLSADARPEALALTLSTEAFRNMKAGHTAFANCMEEDVLIKADRDTPGAAYLVRSMRDSNNKDNETVEEKILASINRFCGSGAVGTVSATRPVFQPMPVRTFFGRVPNTIDRVDALRLALSTQALRVMNAGDEPRGQCIMDNLVKTTTTPEDRTVYSQGFKSLAQALAVAGNSVIESVEEKIMGAIVSQCGDEKPTKDKH
jgi:hypothetical protein